jgi:uncharacterized protein (TIGR02001 family)
MRKSVLSAAVAAALAVPALANAQAPAPAPSPITGNLTIASDYRFRGISQTYTGPAIQGGVDYAHASGIYLGNWNSNVSSFAFLGGSGIEMDFYGGYKKSFGDFGLDVGTIYYYYPNAEVNSTTIPGTSGSSSFDNWEVYIGGSWKWISAKLYYALDNYFGLDNVQADNFFANRNTLAPLGGKGDSKGTTYIDLTATYPVNEKLSIIGHYGMLKVKNYGELDYNDWKIGATYDLNGWVFGAAYVDSDANSDWYYTFGSKGNKETGKSTVVFSVSKSF